ncbi:MAG: FliM/FliN family flagellar motor switch protein [Allgaiera sp.]|jgi:flagellar motor switch protein FliM|nr:FliM/FliN family flagellar motor switch protein [Allgaiera sp.]
MPETSHTIDLLKPETVFVNRLPDMTGVVERLFRHFRALLFQEFRYTLQSADGQFRILSHDEYLGNRPGYNLYGILALPPIKGLSLVILEGPLLAALVDELFGASAPAEPDQTRAQISIMESRIGRRLIEMIVTSVNVAFEQYFPIAAEIVRTEGFSALASVADAAEPFCVLSTTLSLSTGTGSVSIAIPYRGLEPFSEVLGAPMGGESQKEAHSQWVDRIAASIDNVPVEVAFEIGSIQLSAGALAALSEGDVLPLTLHHDARAIIGGAAVGTITYGADGANYGVYFGNDQQEQ